MKKIFIAITLTAILLYLPIICINQPVFQKWFIKTYRPLAPWKIELKSLTVQPFPPRLKIKGLEMEHPSGHQLKLESLRLKIKLWRLLRGQLALSPLKMQGLHISIAKPLKVAKKKERKRFKWRTLLLLQNLILEEGKINDIVLSLPSQRRITIAKLGIRLEPALLGGTKLNLSFDNFNQQVQKAVFQVTTDFNHWYKTFPYVNDLNGKLLLSQAVLGKLKAEKLAAELTYRGFKLQSEKFVLQIGKNELRGKLESRLRKQTFALDFETPQPLTIPELGDSLRTFNVAGDLQLKLHAEGKGFVPTRSQGQGTLEVTHRFVGSEDHPVTVALDCAWDKGLVQIAKGVIAVDEAKVEAQGAFKMKPPRFDLQFHSDNFPLERFFEKFEDTDLHPIFGQGAFQGTFQGLKKDLHLALSGEAKEGGYGPLKAQKAKVDLNITYEKLHLMGSLLTDDKPTGSADLVIDYGPKTPGQTRPKKINLLAQFNQHPLEKTLPETMFRGEIDAQFKLTGKNQDLQGEGTVTAKQGELLGIAYESIAFPFQLNKKQIVISQVQSVLPNQPIDFVNPIVFNIIPQGMNISGKPIAGLDFDLHFASPSQTWQIKRLEYKNPAAPEFWASLGGSLSPSQVALKGKGHLDGASLMFLSRLIREAQGPFAFEIQTSGSPSRLNLQGKVQLEKNLLSLRIYPLTVEELEGTLALKGNRIETEKLTGLLGVGRFELAGSLAHEDWRPKFYDLSFKGSQLYFRNQPGFVRMEYDADLTLKGPENNALLQGKLTILDGRYTKDFNIIEEIKAGQKPPKEIQTAVKEGTPIQLDVKVRNLGELSIDNNVGRIQLTTNLQVKGKSWAPHVEGTIEVAEGEIHYLGLDFDITRGFMEFRDPYTYPYLEVEAEQEIADAHIVARLHGRTDNLTIDLEGNSATLGPLERKDVASLILFGTTTSERYRQSQYQQFELGPELIAEQITYALQRPMAKLVHLDVFRLEAEPTQEGRVRRFHVGKQITDRLHVEFASEVDREDALQTFFLEYWLTDFLIFKGSRQREEGYQLNAGFRLTSR